MAFACVFSLNGYCQEIKQLAKNENLNAKAIVMENMFKSMPSADLYDDWNTTRCHSITEVVPNAYKIDLREFSMPIEHSHVTSEFGRRWGRNHNGIDIKAYTGDTVRATFKGKVRVVKYDSSGYGNVIVIRHWNGLETVYGHLSKQIVKVNEIVEAGQPIGLAGNTGRSTGTHLHFETRFCGIPINPNEIFSIQDRDVINDFYHWEKK